MSVKGSKNCGLFWYTEGDVVIYVQGEKKTDNMNRTTKEMVDQRR